LHDSPFHVLQQEKYASNKVVVEHLNESMKSVTMLREKSHSKRKNIEVVDFKCKSGRDIEICMAVPEIQTVYRKTIAMRQGTMFVSKT